MSRNYETINEMMRILRFIGKILRNIFEFLSEDDTQAKKTIYRYKHKNFLMTYNEAQFFNRLIEQLGQEYHVFAQVHLPSIIDHEVRNGQNWRAALSHINRKSVDYVLCEKNHLRPVLAIELDDKSHDNEIRIARDREVERILAEAELPLVRFRSPEKVSDEEIMSNITEAIRK